MRIKLNENENSGMLYAIAYCEDPDIYSEEFWGWDTESDVGYELMEFGSLIQDADVFESLEAAEDRADDVLSSIFEDEVFIVGLDPYTPHNLTGFVKKVTRDSINESNSIKEDTFGYKSGNRYYGGLPSEGSDTDYAELMSNAASEEEKFLAKYGVKKEHRSTSFDSGEDKYTGNINGHDFEYIESSRFPNKHWASKLVIDNKEVDIYKSKSDPGYWATIDNSFSISDLIDMLSNDRFDAIVFKKSPEELKKVPLYSFTRSNTYSGYFTPNDILRQLERVRNHDYYKYPNVKIKTRLLSGGSYPCIEEKYIGPKDELVAFMRAVGLKSKFDKDIKLEQPTNESKSIKESATGDYIEVAYICDGFTNFRVFGGGFKTSDALVSVEDEKGKRLRLTMGDVCEFYTWHDAKGNVIHEPGYIDDANLNENYVPEYGDEFPNMNAAMYVARSLVYHFVSDPDDAEKLYAKAESDGWESSELVALCDLIGDALEASNYHSEARDYFYDKFPYWWAFDVSAEDEAKMDELIESCDDDNQRMQLLIIAVNSLVLELD